ncbi:MAG: DUF2345 domain-containing protein [Chania sp.]
MFCKGPIEMQAQNGNLRLFAEKKLTLSSADDISFAGKKRITLIGGGSYVKIEMGKIEYGTTAQYVRKVKRTAKMGKADMPINVPQLPGQYPPLQNKVCIECLLNAIKANDAVVQGA